MALIAARYIGTEDVTLPDNVNYLDGNGNPFTKSILQNGDTLMMNDFDILGQTLLKDSTGNVQVLGLGRVILPADQGLSDDALAAKGYLFSNGRTDFVAV